MLRNPISYIFKLGKHRSLPLRPLSQLSAQAEELPQSLPTLPRISDRSAKNGQAQHSNQMSS